jgi:hypothetical protein
MSDNVRVLEWVRIGSTHVYIQVIERTFDENEPENKEVGLRFCLDGPDGSSIMDPRMPLTGELAASIVRLVTPYLGERRTR